MKKDNARIIKLHHPNGHPYWQRNKFKIELESGAFINCNEHSKYQGDYGEEYEISVESDGIYVQYFTCSSGLGKSACGEKHKLLGTTDYEKIEYVGVPLVMSPGLLASISERYKQ